MDSEGRKELAQKLTDPYWRLSNLYCVRPEGGGLPIPFKPRPEQEMIYRHLLETPQIPVFIIKSRRLGFSTALGIFSNDLATWNAGKQISLVDQTQPDAWKKMREIIRYAHDTMPPHLKRCFTTPKREDSQLSVRAVGHEELLDSHIYAGMNARGGDNSLLWVSEWGKFANDAKHRLRSQEIRSGAWNSARKGMRVVETTWEGGRVGELWEIIQPVLEQQPNAEGKIYFFPWHNDPTCVSLTGEITPEVAEYFAEVESNLGRQFSAEQKKWWAVTQASQKQYMKTEFPSTIDEALSAPGMHPRFSVACLDWMEKQMRPTPPTSGYIKHDKMSRKAALIPARTMQDDTAWFREWEQPQPGMSYIIPIDFCTAVQVVEGDPDSHALPVLRDTYMDPSGTIHAIRTVGAISIDNRTKLGTFVEQIAAIACYYADAMVVPEINNMRGIIELLRAAGVLNIYERTLNPDSKGDKRLRKEPGWETTAATKPVMLGQLDSLIEAQGLIVECPRMLHELRMFQDTNEAASGHHDDWVMALGIGVMNIRFATRYAVRMPVVMTQQHLSPAERQAYGLPETGMPMMPGVDDPQAFG